MIKNSVAGIIYLPLHRLLYAWVFVGLLLMQSAAISGSTASGETAVAGAYDEQSSTRNMLIEMMPSMALKGHWITEGDGEPNTMLNPQSSGLTASEKGWWTVSDASAHSSQIQRLHLIDKTTKHVTQKLGPFVLAPRVENSCFADYLAGEPDYEALVAHPFKYDAWILVTEDASRTGALSKACQQRFAQTGSTNYPSLIVEVMLRDGQMIVSGVRAVQFSQDDDVGNFPNDGIEGLSIDRENRLYLGLEKDAKGQPRIFYVDLTPDTFSSPRDFLKARDAKLNLPTFAEGNHPINGMDIYYPNDSAKGILIAAARNDNELWLIDLAGKQATRILPLVFYAPSDAGSCAEYHQMNNASIEGVAVDGNTLILINDPWKENYLKNVQCEADREKYERMSPLIFSLPITW
ncbi:hypothetical protein ACFO4O_16170 [Glaciecola siphonariae]|uniref:Phytase-like domain-containing protein n=1 Tax=Glaciecola siphonariae TaxID=521012 RepID=A0ABV9M215_9ALTE